MPICAHTMVHATLVGHRDIHSTVGTVLGPHHLIVTSISAIVPVMIFEGQQNALQKEQTS